MSQITWPKNLSPTGTISFKLNPIENGKDKLYLIDFGTEQAKNRITLTVVKNVNGTKDLMLELFNNSGQTLETQMAFPGFQIGVAFDVELVWSTEKNKIAVFIDNEQFLLLEDAKIIFDDFGSIIHYGEDIIGQNKTEMTAE